MAWPDCTRYRKASLVVIVGSPALVSVWGGLTIGQAMAARANNFSVLRLVLAAAVIVSHGFSIPTGDNTLEPFYRSTGLRLGEYAVNCFFAISGFLVTMSYLQRGPRDYVIARILRIVPGFLAAAFVTVFVIGAACTSLPLSTYFTDPALYAYLRQVLTGFKSAGAMPGVFTDNPHPWPLGTIWTLRYEIALYGAVLLFGLAGALKTWRIAGLLAAFLFLVIIVVDGFIPQTTRYAEVLLRLVFMFVLGSAFFLARDLVKLSWPLLAIFIVVTWFSHGTAFYFALLYLTLAYGVLLVAFGPLWPGVNWADKTDLSYGIYLFGWPVQQVLVQLFPAASVWALLAPALIVSALIAWVSWHGVEAPALRLKAAFTKRQLRFSSEQGT